MPAQEALLKQQQRSAQATYFPHGQLVILGAATSSIPVTQPTLAWKFEVVAQKPLSWDYLYVDAQSGKILGRVSRIADALGRADTYHHGIRDVVTELDPRTNEHSTITFTPCRPRCRDFSARSCTAAFSATASVADH